MFDMRSFSVKRYAGAASAALLACGLLLAGTFGARAWHSTDMTGALPPLQFTMTRASDGKVVTAANYKGKIVLLYFGYTYCPDVCPATLFNISSLLKKLGPKANEVRVLFVTVDPNRDTVKVLKDYTGAFAPQIVGLRGTPNQLATLAKCYRVAYSVTPASPGHPYEVSHSSGVYAFDRSGDIKLLFSDLSQPKADLSGTFDDLRDLIAQSDRPSLLQRVLNVF
jgi:protein SCO1/2